MMTNDNMNRWCAVHAAFKSERKLMQRLNAEGIPHFVLCKSYIRNGMDEPEKYLCLFFQVVFL